MTLTPSWTCHDHGNDSSEPMVWLEGLNVPSVKLLDAQFREEGADDMQHMASAGPVARVFLTCCFESFKNVTALRWQSPPVWSAHRAPV